MANPAQVSVQVANDGIYHYFFFLSGKDFMTRNPTDDSTHEVFEKLILLSNK